MDGSRLPPQAVTRQAIDLADQSLSHRFELPHQGLGPIESAKRRLIFEIRRRITGQSGEHREQTAEFVGGLTQPRRVLDSECLAHFGESSRRIAPEILA